MDSSAVCFNNGMEKELVVQFKPLCANAMVPKRHSSGAAGYDLHTIRDGFIKPHSYAIIRTGFALIIPSGLFGFVCGRSGLSINHGIEVRSSYCVNNEELCLCLHNTSNVPFRYENGMRVAQLVFLETVPIDSETCAEQ